MMNVELIEPINGPFEVVEGDSTFMYDNERMFYHYGKRLLHVKVGKEPSLPDLRGRMRAL